MHFLLGIAGCLEPGLAVAFKQIAETNCPGLTQRERKWAGCSLTISRLAEFKELRYNDELAEAGE